MEREKLENFLKNLLSPHTFQDYCPNGLQVIGKENISRIAFAVSATKDSISQAVDAKADCLIVHHGLFWKFHGVRTLTGPFAKRIFPLVKNDINLFAYHLPLDANLEIGNAVCLANQLQLFNIQPFGDYKGSPTGVKGILPQSVDSNTFNKNLKNILDHQILHSRPETKDAIKTVGIITGGANSDWLLALKENLDCYITGEMSEHDWHEAKEAGIHMFAGGHHATEKFGVQALMKKINNEFKVDCIYIDSKNPA
jgi:dinuclear metal center YbgI/SA1388 family protein